MSNTVGFRWCVAIKSAIHSKGNHHENDYLELRRHTLRCDRCLAASTSSATFPSHVSVYPPSFPPCATPVLLSICRSTEPGGLLYSPASLVATIVSKQFDWFMTSLFGHLAPSPFYSISTSPFSLFPTISPPYLSIPPYIRRELVVWISRHYA